MGRRAQAVIILGTAVLGLAVLPAAGQDNSATYRIAPSEAAAGDAPTLRVTVGPAAMVGNEAYRWWELVYQAPLEATPRLTAQFLSDRAPLRADGGTVRHIARYLYAERGLPPVEYVDAGSGEALLPEFQFLEYFIPQSASHTTDLSGFVPAGRYLGRALKLLNTESVPWSPLAAAVLPMRRDLIIGTGRVVKDDGTGIGGSGDYTYVSWTAQDYEDMIAAGHNSFMFGAVPRAAFHDRPIFHTAAVSAAEWPEQFYRSSYLGPTRYLDEPTSRGYGPLRNFSSYLHFPEEMGVFTEVYVRTAVHEAMRRIQDALDQAGIDTGDMKLHDPDVEIWETIYEAAYYHFAGGGGAFIHESRFVLDDFNNQIQNYFMVNETLTRDEMFEFYYSAMRGGARPFGKAWGMSIYGQMEPASLIPSAIKAYDMGARHLWFWTTDRDHHVPYADQLAIAQAVTDHAALNPRPDPTALLYAAETAILLPYGYVLGGGHPLSNRPEHGTSLWGQVRMPLDGLNRSGATHRSILTAAVGAGIAEMRAGRAMDFAIDAPGFDPAGYIRIIRVAADGTVTTQIQ